MAKKFKFDPQAKFEKTFGVLHIAINTWVGRGSGGGGWANYNKLEINRERYVAINVTFYRISKRLFIWTAN